MKKVVIIGGGTFSHVRNHLALAAPAFGSTAKMIHAIMSQHQLMKQYHVQLTLTKMANPESDLITNQDVSNYVDRLIEDQDVKIIVFNAALCDFNGTVDSQPSGSHAERLKTADGAADIRIVPADKLIKRIRKERKDIFLVAFKTTTSKSIKDQYIAGLNLLKANSCNLVLANDTVTRTNMIIVPEEAKYDVTTNREDAMRNLCEIIAYRSRLTYTRSTVVEGTPVPWSDPEIPDSLRKVVDYCISKGAYKPFRGSTAGHFAVKLSDDTFLTSRRKTNYNDLDKVGLVKVKAVDDDTVVAYGSKPSVGGQSQRIVFKEHPGYDCIVHFHSPLKDHGDKFGQRSQRWLECGSHECGQNTSNGLTDVGDGIKAVYLDNHGPNIVFRRDVAPEKVIAFISKNFDLSSKTGGLVHDYA